MNILRAISADSSLAALAHLQELAGQYHSNALRSGRDGARGHRNLYQRLRHSPVGHVGHLLHPGPPVAAHAGVPQVADEQGEAGGGQGRHGESGAVEQEDC